MRSEHLLRPYQCRGSDIIVRNPICAGFIDMGLGKTIMCLTAIADIKQIVEVEKQRKRRFKWLVIAPIKVAETVWRQEAADWEHTAHLSFSLIRGNVKERAFALAKEADVYLINPELVKWLNEYLRNSWSMFNGLIVDESSLFKDHRSGRFKYLTNYGLPRWQKDQFGVTVRDTRGQFVRIPPHRFERTVILTGTPRPQSSMNLWSQIFMLDHGARLHKTFETFRSRYFLSAGKIGKHVQRFKEGDLAKPDDLDADGNYKPFDGAPEKIHELIADISVELNAEDMGILPPVVPVFHYVELPTALRAEYKKLENEAIIELKQAPVIAANGGVKTMLCWQYANGAMYEPLVDGRGRRTWQLLHDALLDELESVAEQLDTNMLIGIQFQHDRERIIKRFKDAVVLPRKSEEVVKAWNRGEISKLVLHPRSGSHGLNIQFGGHHLAFFGGLWSNEQYRQLIRRLARPGQPHPFVNVHHFMTSNTVHELQYASVQEKGADEQRFRKALDAYQRAQQLGIHAHELYTPDIELGEVHTDGDG